MLAITEHQLAIYKAVSGDPNHATKNEFASDIEIIRFAITNPELRETLKALHDSGPLFDGDVPSKLQRDKLLNNDYVAKVVMKGEQGFNACTYKGRFLLRCYNTIMDIDNDVAKKAKQQVIDNIHMVLNAAVVDLAKHGVKVKIIIE